MITSYPVYPIGVNEDDLAGLSVSKRRRYLRRRSSRNPLFRIKFVAKHLPEGPIIPTASVILTALVILAVSLWLDTMTGGQSVDQDDTTGQDVDRRRMVETPPTWTWGDVQRQSVSLKVEFPITQGMLPAIWTHTKGGPKEGWPVGHEKEPGLWLESTTLCSDDKPCEYFVPLERKGQHNEHGNGGPNEGISTDRMRQYQAFSVPDWKPQPFAVISFKVRDPKAEAAAAKPESATAGAQSNDRTTITKPPTATITESAPDKQSTTITKHPTTTETTPSQLQGGAVTDSETPKASDALKPSENAPGAPTNGSTANPANAQAPPPQTDGVIASPTTETTPSKLQGGANGESGEDGEDDSESLVFVGIVIVVLFACALCIIGICYEHQRRSKSAKKTRVEDI